MITTLVQYLICSLFRPRFKSFTFVSDSEKDCTVDQITVEASTCCISANEADFSAKSAFRGE